MRLRSDEQLVARFRAGNDDAFRAIHDRYHAHLFAYALQMLGGARQDAEDVVQDVLVRAYRTLRSSERSVALRPWLYLVAHNRCIDLLRKRTPEPRDVLAARQAPDDDPTQLTERREELRSLVRDLRRLPEQQRSALLMRELQGLSYAEMAVALDLSVPAVKSALVRARKSLVDAATARDTACESVRADLALACDRGVRASGLAWRHLHECAPCRQYREDLRGVRRGLSALVPTGPIAALSHVVLGVGGTGTASVVAGVGATATATKVAVVVATAALTTGGVIVATEQPSAARAAPAPHAAASVPPQALARATVSPRPRPAKTAASKPRPLPRATRTPAPRRTPIVVVETPERTPAAIQTATATASPRPALESTPTATETATAVATATVAVTPTATPTPRSLATPTPHSSVTDPPPATPTPTPTKTPAATARSAPPPTPTPTPTPKPGITPQPVVTAAPTPTPSPRPSAVVTGRPSPTPTP